jgi:hypothetical protein
MALAMNAESKVKLEAAEKSKVKVFDTVALLA